MLFLYNLPGWLMAVCIVGTVVGLAYPGYFLIRQVWRRSFTDVETNVSMAVLTVIATIYALLLAFVAVSVWQSFGAAETAAPMKPTASASSHATCRSSTAQSR
jgi:heme/copper-type cytochrome/quinol oxidase subunit 2